MVEIFGNAWEIAKDEKYDALCITTNGTITKAGRAVMGAGIAKEATIKCSGIEKVLGECLKMAGNRIYKIGKKGDLQLLSFPVKHNWFEDADIKLIEQSLIELMIGIDRNKYEKVMLPRPGCGNGNLDWESVVKPLVEKHVDDRVHIVHFKED